MWAHARYDLHLSSEEFWELTPCEFYELMDRHRDFVEAQYVPVIQLAQFISLFINLNPNLPAEFRNTEPTDFIPRMGSVEAQEEPVEAAKPDGSYRMSLWDVYAKTS